MLKRLLFLITFTCGLLIVPAIGTSSFLPHLAVAQAPEVRNCTRTCKWVRQGIIFRRECATEVPEFPRGRPPSCYRADWDLDDDGVMEIRTEADAEAAASSSSQN